MGGREAGAARSTAPRVRTEARPHQSALNALPQVYKQVWKDVRAGRVLVAWTGEPGLLPKGTFWQRVPHVDMGTTLPLPSIQPVIPQWPLPHRSMSYRSMMQAAPLVSLAVKVCLKMMTGGWQHWEKRWTWRQQTTLPVSFRTNMAQLSLAWLKMLLRRKMLLQANSAPFRAHYVHL